MIDIINNSSRKNMTTQLWSIQVDDFDTSRKLCSPFQLRGQEHDRTIRSNQGLSFSLPTLLFRVLTCNNNPIYNGTGVSSEILCLPEDDVFGTRLCLVLLNFNI